MSPTTINRMQNYSTDFATVNEYGYAFDHFYLVEQS